MGHLTYFFCVKYFVVEPARHWHLHSQQLVSPCPWKTLEFVTSEIQSLHFTEEKIKAQRGCDLLEATCPAAYW